MAAKTGFPGLPDAGGTPREVAAVFNQMLRRQSSWTGFAGGVSNIGNTSGATGSFHGPLIPAGGNNITLSQSTNSAGATYTISGPNMMAAGISNLGNTAGSSGVQSQQLVLVGTNGITLSGSTNASGQATISISAGGAGGNFSGGVSNLGNTAGSTGVTGTRLVFVGTNNISLSQSTDANGGTISISGQSPAGGAFSGGVSNLGNTAGSTGVTGTRLVLVGTNAVSLSQSTDANGGTVSINVTIPAQTAESQSIGISNLGNTSGTSGIASGAQVRFLFAGGNNITLSQSLNGASGTITISGPNTAAQTVESNTFGMSNLGNTSGTSGVISGGQLQMIIVGTNNITVSQSINGASATLSISGPAAAAAAATRSIWFPYQNYGLAGNTVAQQIGNGSIQVGLVECDNNFSVSRFNVFVTNSLSSSSNSSHAGAISVFLGIYTRNVSTLSLSTSGSGLNSWSNTSSNSFSVLTGAKMLSGSINANLTPGQYWLAFMSRTSTTNANWFTATNLQIGGILTLYHGLMGAASNASNQIVPGYGTFSATSAGMPTSMAFSDLRGSEAVGQRVPIMNLVNFTA